jgi:hypothetical protein
VPGSGRVLGGAAYRIEPMTYALRGGLGSSTAPGFSTDSDATEGPASGTGSPLQSSAPPRTTSAAARLARERPSVGVRGCPPASTAGGSDCARRTRTMVQDARSMSLIFPRLAVPDVRNDFSWAADGRGALPSVAPFERRPVFRGQRVACLPFFASI